MTITASDARANLFRLIEQVNEDQAGIEITSRRGNAILVSKSEYESLVETAFLLRSPVNAERLLRSMEQARAGEFTYREIVTE